MKFNRDLLSNLQRRQSSSHTTRNIIIATIGGIAAGAIAGLLLAPEKGRETRKRIADNASKLGSDVKDSVNKGWSELNTRVNDVMHSSKEEVEATTSKKGNSKNSGSKTTASSN